MDQENIDKFTRSWFQIKSENDVELFSYFDMLDWKSRHAIRFNGKYISIEDVDINLNPYSVFDLFVQFSKQ